VVHFHFTVGAVSCQDYGFGFHKSMLQVTGCTLQVARCVLRVTGFTLQVASMIVLVFIKVVDKAFRSCCGLIPR
jgi:hypothetical protein